MKFNFTKASVEALPSAPAGKNQEMHYDLKLPGFGVYVTQKGVKTYFVDGTSNGERLRRKIGRHGVIFPDAAREEARIVLLGMSKGEAPSKKVSRTLLDAMNVCLDT